MAVGRTGATLQELGDWLGARLDALLRAWAPEVTAQPTDAAFAADGNGGLTIVADQDGRGIAPNASAARFRERLAQLATAPVGQPLTLRFADKTWTLGTAALGAALRYRREGGALVLGLQPGPLRAFFDQVGGAIATPPTDAMIALAANGTYRIVPAADGTALDEATALRVPRGAAIAANDLAPAYAHLNTILNTPLVVSFQEFSRTYRRADIAPMLIITPQASAPEYLTFTLDGAKLTALVADLATTLDQDARDAKFRWVNGAVQDVAGGQADAHRQPLPGQVAEPPPVPAMPPPGDRPTVGAAGGRAARADHHGDAALVGGQFFQRQALGVGQEGCASHSDLRGARGVSKAGYSATPAPPARARPALTKRSSYPFFS